MFWRIFYKKNKAYYYLTQQSQNELISLDYYDLINEFKKDNVSWLSYIKNTAGKEFMIDF